MLSPNEIKRRASALVKASKKVVKHVKALDLIAQEEGSADWQTHKRAWKNRNKTNEKE